MYNTDTFHLSGNYAVAKTLRFWRGKVLPDFEGCFIYTVRNALQYFYFIRCNFYQCANELFFKYKFTGNDPNRDLKPLPTPRH